MLLSLTLVGPGVSSDQVLEFKAVRAHLLLRLTAHGCHVAVLHLAGAAAGPRVEAHAERLIWEGEGTDSARSRDVFFFIHSDVPQSHAIVSKEYLSLTTQ